MKNSIRLLACSIFIHLFALSGANATALNSGDVLKFANYTLDSTTGWVDGGAFFSLDLDGDNNLEPWERVGMTRRDGIIVGSVQLATGHAGPPTVFDSGSIDWGWSFFGNTGMHLTVTAPTSSNGPTTNTAYLNMSGWGIAWGGIPMLSLGSGAWGTNPNGQAVVTCSSTCAGGDTFSLYYTATIPVGDPSGFGGLRYRLGVDPSSSPSVIQSLGFAQAADFTDSDPGMVLSGTIAAAVVPLPLSIWLFASGLAGLTGFARIRGRRNS